MNTEKILTYYNEHKGAIKGAAIGFVTAVLILVLGFLKVLFIAIFTGVGYYIGKRMHEDQNYIKTAVRNRNSSLEPTLKSLVIIGITASLIVTFLSIGFAIFLVLQNAFPTVMLFVLVPGIAIEMAIIRTLIMRLRKLLNG
jgi:uncharacterized membrane protein